MVDYSYYKGVYGGVSINDAIQFRRLAWGAEMTLNGYLNVPLKTIEDPEMLDKINMLLCYMLDNSALAELISGVKTSKVDNVSVTYQDGLGKAINIEPMIYNSLRGTGLLISELDEIPIAIGYVRSRKRC